ncbi:MAG TPA: hypothetical protein VK870_01890 [Ignavibacteriaceae bacterium]|nr:hypothetical protein [Ignavibacteriaceae bacterium]
MNMVKAMTVTALLLISQLIQAQSIPTIINYQGLLKDVSGVVVPDGDYNITFRLYDVATGGTGLWAETKLINVVEGIINTKLGSILPLTLPFDKAYWLGITIGTGSELTPRVEFTSVPYSHISKTVPDGTLTAEKLSDGQVVKSINSLKDNVNILAGTNITLTPSGNNITINAAGGGGGTVTQINTGGGLTGGPITTTGTISIPANGIISEMILDGTIRSYDIGNAQVVKTINNLMDNVSLVAGSNITITPSGQNITISSTASGGIGGSGTINYIPRFTSSSALGNSTIYQSGNNIGIGTTSPLYKLDISSAGNTVFRALNTESSAITSVAVFGSAKTVDGYGIGGEFIGGQYGVRGIAEPVSTNRFTYGVYGLVQGSNAASKFALFGFSNAVTGSTGNLYGLYGYAGGVATVGSRFGVYATASGGETNYAGYFSGNVSVTGTLSKGGGSFKIDHPLDPANKYLYHSFVESPDMKNIYDGNVTTDASGYASVILPDWFEALNKDFRYQLTVIGDFAQAIIAEEMQGNSFVIRTDKPNVKVSWQITGIRKDAFAERYRIPVEEIKQGHEAGKYLHPEAFNIPAELGIDYENNNTVIEADE